ncbi:MAG: hypothetical protein IJ250_02750 [Bacteroidales bacterium]|nr:hypothetical protein [Bacteroidales bacterium]
MNKEQEEQVTKALVEFITKVANGKTVSETEIMVLPDAVNALTNLSNNAEKQFFQELHNENEIHNGCISGLSVGISCCAALITAISLLIQLLQ